MAGEIEEPFRMNFQADSIHSGSISFGRFETEALCWERRSSFSHNRYLEEVEKCSKPGSVIEKKAYFEARLRKKGILGILGHSSPDSPNEKVYQTSEIDVSDSHSEIDHMSAENRSAHFDQRSETDASDHHSTESDNMSAENRSARFDDSPVGAAYEVEHEVSQFESEVFGTSVSEPQMEIACHSTERVNSVTEDVKVEELNNAVVVDLPLSDSILAIGLQEKPDGEVRNLNQIGPCINYHEAEVNTSTSATDQQGSFIKEKSSPVAECIKPRLTSRLGVTKSRKNISSKELKGSNIKPGEKEKVNEVKLRTVTKRSEAATQNKYQIRKTPKNEPASRTQGVDRIRSAGRESRGVVVSAPQYSTVKKAPVQMSQSAIRSKPTAGEPKPRIKQQVGPRSDLKCNGSSQNRGQFGISLEEKVPKLETKTQLLHAKTQEKKAEIKQLSKSLNLNKSLNFKAKPLPSFYHGALRESDRNKGTLHSVKPRKPQTDLLNSLNSGTRVGTRIVPTPVSLQQRKGPSDIHLASGAMSCHSTVTSDSNPPSPAAGTGNNHVSLGEINRLIGVKNGRTEKSTSISKHKVPESKGRTMDVKHKTRTGRTTTYAACKK